MSKIQKESHLRSIIKGISWRIIATTDTVVIVLIITCLNGNCSLDNALKIGLIEFLLKLIVYYIHERVWQNLFNNREVTKRHTLIKTVSWRIVATTMTFLISGAILNAYDEIALYIALTELFTKFVLYYFHERLWLQLPLGRVRRFFRNQSK